MKINNKLQIILTLCILILAACAVPAPEVVTSTPAPTAVSADMIKIEPLPNYLYGVFPEPASTYDITSDEYLSRLKRKEPNLIDPSLCVSVGSYHLLEKGDAPGEREFLHQMHLLLNKEIHKVPNTVVAPDIFGSDIIDPETGGILFRTPDGVDFNVCWRVDLSEPGLYTATYVFTKTSGQEETYTWSFIIEE